jgi:hypothetical protein
LTRRVLKITGNPGEDDDPLAPERATWRVTKNGTGQADIRVAIDIKRAESRAIGKARLFAFFGL